MQYRVCVYAICKNEGKFVERWMRSMAEAVAVVKPERMVVSLGINGLSFMSESGFMETYAEFLEGLREASPDTALVVQAILPVSAAYERKDPRMTNEKIDRYNERLRAITEACGGRFAVGTDADLFIATVEFAAGVPLEEEPEAPAPEEKVPEK